MNKRKKIVINLFLSAFYTGGSKRPGPDLMTHSQGQVYDQGCINIDRSYKLSILKYSF